MFIGYRGGCTCIDWLYLVLIIAAIVGLVFSSGDLWMALLTGLITGCAVPIIDAVIQNRKYLRIVSATLRYRRTRVRVSVSYLLRVERNGKYLLVRGKRYSNQFQPIGGVYKVNPSAQAAFRRWKVETDDLIPIDTSSQNDLRIWIKGSHLLSFVRWFESGKNREVGPMRELYEELVMPHLLEEKFRYVLPTSWSEGSKKSDLVTLPMVASC
ncbi:hypothetical protein M8542_01260 [Amycolatopsis sp. OK19-0408]|uniref:CD-NTase-associated protein 16 NUDIX domain-containing protein n=1 Tax=Amycolatopsis iheyensis TaxID=2945988 RepID=A0A9X2SIN6_9PSEU|nr:hypothetical protein [Amycolatopsis iheyensis]